ncbi:HNH endonuclease [Streptomyces sp. NPDC093795]|uniref:HNH endonuclease n=1 Tax=Streptomyces sp. NPDC093795 TaxID=3366051 RepID=UPI003828441A
MCDTVLILPPPRHCSSEAARIRAREDSGPDVVENLLYLCPNCHARFDSGESVLTDDLMILDMVMGKLGEKITLHRWHFIETQYFRQRRHHWTPNDPTPSESAPSAPAEHYGRRAVPAPGKNGTGSAQVRDTPSHKVSLIRSANPMARSTAVGSSVPICLFLVVLIGLEVECELP